MRREFHASPLKNLLLFLLSLGFVAVSCWLVRAGLDERVPALLTLIGLAGAGFFGLCGVMWFRRFWLSGPVVVIDGDGVYDRRVMSDRVLWADIKSIHWVTIRRNRFIALQVDRPERYTKTLSPFARWVRRLNKRYNFGDFSIAFTELRGTIGDFLEAAAQTGQPVAIEAWKQYKQEQSPGGSARRPQDALTPRARFWASTRLVLCAFGGAICLWLTVMAASEITFERQPEDWEIITGTVDGFHIVKRRRIRGRYDLGPTRYRMHAGIFVSGQKVRFAVRDDEYGYNELISSLWVGRTVTVRVDKEDFARATREIDERSADGEAYSRQNLLELFETRIYEMHMGGREVVNFATAYQDKQDEWPIRLAIMVVFLVLAGWLAVKGRRNWRSLCNQPA